nr:MAG TPA: hypothetical protein [Caudoviricetes sp.]
MFQDKIYENLPLGKVGTISRMQAKDSVARIAEKDIKAGSFAFLGSNPEIQVIGCSSATASKKTEDIAGLVIFEKMQNGVNPSSLSVNDGQEITLLRKGYAYVISTTSSSYGQKVLLNPKTGEISTADAISTGLIDTGFVVETSNDVGQVIEIRK